MPSRVSCTGISSSSVTKCTAVCGRADHVLHGVGVAADRADLGQAGHLGGDVQEAADPPGRRSVHHHGVVHGLPRVLAPHRLGCLAGEQHVAQPGRDRGGEVEHAELGERACRRAAGCRTSPGTRSAPTAGRRPGRRLAAARPVAVPGATATLRSSYGSGGTSKTCAMPCLPSTSISSTGLPVGGERQRERGGDRGLACPALAGDDVQPHAIPVGVPHAHAFEAIRRPGPLRPAAFPAGRPGQFPPGQPLPARPSAWVLPSSGKSLG